MYSLSSTTLIADIGSVGLFAFLFGPFAIPLVCYGAILSATDSRNVQRLTATGALMTFAWPLLLCGGVAQLFGSSGREPSGSPSLIVFHVLLYLPHAGMLALTLFVQHTERRLRLKPRGVWWKGEYSPAQAALFDDEWFDLETPTGYEYFICRRCRGEMRGTPLLPKRETAPRTKASEDSTASEEPSNREKKDGDVWVLEENREKYQALLFAHARAVMKGDLRAGNATLQSLRGLEVRSEEKRVRPQEKRIYWPSTIRIRDVHLSRRCNKCKHGLQDRMSIAAVRKDGKALIIAGWECEACGRILFHAERPEESDGAIVCPGCRAKLPTSSEGADSVFAGLTVYWVAKRVLVSTAKNVRSDS